ncbi:Potassium channel AKT6 [Linum perenne]
MGKKSKGMFSSGQFDSLGAVDGLPIDKKDIDQYSVGGGSHFSITGDILPSLGSTRSTPRMSLSRFVISPFDPHYRSWETFLVLLVYYTAWVSPFEFGFISHPNGPLMITDNVVNAIFFVDIVLTFFVAYLEKTTYLLIDSKRLIAWRYIRTWFLFDLVSTIPSEIVRVILPNNLQSYGYVSMLRLWRLRRVSRFFARMEKDKNYSYFWTRCVKLVCRDTIHAASSFAQRNHLPVRLQDQMVAHLSLKYRTDSEGLHQQEAIDTLPKAIRSSIANYLFYSLVDRVYLFRGVSNDLLFQLVSEMKAEYFPPREDVILQNEAPTDMYFLVSGAVELIVHRNAIENIVGEARTGDVVGEIGVLCYRPQLFTVRTKRLSQLLRLNRTSFLNLVQANVGDGTIIMNNALQHLKERNDPIMQEILSEIEHMLAQGRMDLPLTLCFAATRGDDLLLHQILKRGSDPNEADDDSRTAMHIAASNGNEHCVALLLEYGGDPNKKADSEGNVPLWDALHGKHTSVVKMLVDNGATLCSGDCGGYASMAVEKNDLNLLKEIAKYGGDVTLPTSNGSTAIHAAISDGNTEMVKFLVDQGADIDTPDGNGWTARALADHQGHEEIKLLFQNRKEVKKPTTKPLIVQTKMPEGKRIAKYSSEPMITPYTPDFSPRHGLPAVAERTWTDSSSRRRVNTFRNSLFGIMSAANTGDAAEVMTPGGSYSGLAGPIMSSPPPRVILSCPEKGDVSGKLIMLPKSFEEILDIGSKKYEFTASKILTKEGAHIEDIDLIRDGDHIVLSS